MTSAVSTPVAVGFTTPEIIPFAPGNATVSDSVAMFPVGADDERANRIPKSASAGGSWGTEPPVRMGVPGSLERNPSRRTGYQPTVRCQAMQGIRVTAMTKGERELFKSGGLAGAPASRMKPTASFPEHSKTDRADPMRSCGCRPLTSPTTSPTQLISDRARWVFARSTSLRAGGGAERGQSSSG
jgi:hypothetical protein